MIELHSIKYFVSDGGRSARGLGGERGRAAWWTAQPNFCVSFLYCSEINYVSLHNLTQKTGMRQTEGFERTSSFMVT